MANSNPSPPSPPPRSHSRAVSSSSSLFALVPSAVVTRITRVNSLRRSLSAYALRPSPPPSPPKRCHMQSASDDWDKERPRSVGSDGSVEGTVLRGVQGNELVTEAWDPRSVETWKFANQGLSLLSSAVAETQLPPERASPAYARQLYVNGVAFLLRGLPSNLDNTETAVLRAAAPSAVVDPAEFCGQNGEGSRGNRAQKQAPSLLHRGLAATVVSIFTLVALVLPLVQILVQRLVEHERRHRTVENAVGVMMEGMSTWVRRLVGLLCEILEGGDGKLVGVLAGAAIWWVEGIAGGIHAGVNEGLPLVKKGDWRSA